MRQITDFSELEVGQRIRAVLYFNDDAKIIADGELVELLGIENHDGYVQLSHPMKLKFVPIESRSLRKIDWFITKEIYMDEPDGLGAIIRLENHSVAPWAKKWWEGRWTRVAGGKWVSEEYPNEGPITWERILYLVKSAAAGTISLIWPGLDIHED